MWKYICVLGVTLLVCFQTCEANWSPLDEMFCGNDDCYELIGVKRDATLTEIKKKFRRVSLQYHPDKNPTPEGLRTFQKIAKANEVLTNSETREAYDYYLDNPNSLYALYYGIRAVYPARSSPVVVVILILCVLSALQYANDNWRYHHVVSRIKSSKNFKKAVESELDAINRKWQSLPEDELQELMTRVEESIIEDRVVIDGHAPKKAHWRDMLIIKTVMSPYYTYQYLSYKLRWFIKFDVLKEEYGDEEKEYITQQRSNMTPAVWNKLPEEEKKEYLEKELWKDANYDSYLEDKAEKERLARINDVKYRRWQRWKKKNPDTSYMAAED